MTHIYIAVEGLRERSRENLLLNDGQSPSGMSETELYNLTCYPDVMGGIRRTASQIRTAAARTKIRLGALVAPPSRGTTPDSGTAAL